MRSLVKFLITILLTLLLTASYGADLLTVYKQAEASSPYLKQQIALDKAQTATADAQRGTLLPQLSLTASAGINSTYDSYYQSKTAKVELTQDIFSLNGWADWRNAKQQAYAQSAKLIATRQRFILDVATSYFNILNAEDVVSFDQAKLKFLKQNLSEVKNKLSVGLGTVTDYKQSLADYDTAKAQLIKDENNLQVAYEDLRKFTGISYKQLSTLKSDFKFSKPVPSDVDYWIKHASANNASLKSQKQMTQASKDNVTSQYGSHLPTVQLVAAYTHSDNDSTGLAASSIGYNTLNSNSIALQLSWNVFQGGSLFAAQTQAANLYEAQLDTQTNLYRTIISDIKKDYLNIIKDIQQINAYQQSVVANEASLTKFQEQYKVGSETIVNVLNQLQNLYQAKQNLAKVQYKYITDMLQLRLDSGTLNQETLKSLNSWLN